MRLTIDSSPCDIADDTRFEVGYNADLLLSPESSRHGRSVKLILPHTTTNDLLFNADPTFNTRPHTAELTCDGARLHSGVVRLLSIADTGYIIEIRGGAAQWAKNAAHSTLDTTALGFTGYLTPTDISRGWSDDRPVKFLPVLRDSYEQQNNAIDLQPVLRLLSPDDYHPFIQTDALLRAIFTEAGYTVESRFMEGEFFRSLYVSGAYASRDMTAAEKRMGFRAIRLTSATAAADSIGRVYATPYGAVNIVGNIVETTTPLATDENGIVRSEPYNNGNCFRLEDRKIVYRPTTPMRIGFEYRMRYTTDHRIVSRERLTGFDTVNLGTGGNISFHLPNRYTDRRDNLRTNTSYRIVSFGGTAAAQYRLLYTLNGQAETPWHDFTGCSALVTTPSTGVVSKPVLYVRNGSVWALYAGDWALYDGHIGETGQTTVEFSVRTPAQAVGPSNPKYFNTIFFAGAEEGMRLTLHTECALRPLFSPAPAYGTQLSAAEVMQHKATQQELLEAVQHLFNLRFYTDEQTKKVYIEPDADFWDQTHEADWRGRTDFGESIAWEDAAVGVHESRTYGYLAGDGATKRLDDDEGTAFGSWHTHTNSYASVEGDEKHISPLFSPTLNASGSYTAAPSALLMQVGDRDNLSGDGTNFTPRIVRYCGLRSLPSGERWDGTSESNSYPFAAFHFAGDATQEGFTLCFDDRDGQQGLHRFYNREQVINASRRHIAITLRIEPYELEALFTLDTETPNLRRVFRISTDEGDVCATLSRIETYDPTRNTVRCAFTLLPYDR